MKTVLNQFSGSDRNIPQYRGGMLGLRPLSGVDMALWDILGKAAGKPVHKLLGGSFCDEVRAYASMLMPETEQEVRELVTRYAEQGFAAMKFGYGPLGKDVRRDVRLASAAKEAAGEQDVGRWTFRRLIWDAHLDVLQPDISRVGGLTEAKRIAYMAHEMNRVCVPHAFRTGVLVAACLHLIAAIPNSAFLEFSVTDSPLRRGLLVEPFQVVKGYVRVPSGPGLGIEINQETVKAYSVV